MPEVEKIIKLPPKRKETFKDNDHYRRYIASLFANTVGTIEPKIKFSGNKSKELQKEWDKLLEHNNILEINYQLIEELSKEGCMALVLSTYFKKPKIVPAKIIDIQYESNGDINSFELQFYLPRPGKCAYNISCSCAVKTFKYTFHYYDSVDAKTNGVYNSHTQYYDDSIFTIFLNNPMGKNDMDNVPSKLITDINKHLDLLMTDSLTARSLYHINSPQSQAKNENIAKLKETLKDPNSLYFENKNILSMLATGGLQIQSGTSIGQVVLDKLKFYDNKVKELTFCPRNTADMGTKNIHSAEAMSINSQSDDYIEVKANLLEKGWTQFIKNVFIDYVKNNLDSYKDIDFEGVEVDVEISGSTKYLKDQENEYLQTQQGSLINPNKQAKQPNQGEGNED